MIGVNHADQGNAEFLSFSNSDLVVADIDHKDRVRQGQHVLNATDVLFELRQLTCKHELLFLAHGIKAGFLLDLHFFKPLDRGLDGLKVGQHTAEPTLVNVRHASALRFCGNGVARLALCTNHQNSTATSRQLTYELRGILEHRQRFFQVDDVNLVAMAKNKWRHLRIPEAGLMSKMDAGFKHFTHSD